MRYMVAHGNNILFSNKNEIKGKSVNYQAAKKVNDRKLKIIQLSTLNPSIFI